MCGCGCELGLVLASCQAAEAQRAAAQPASAGPRRRSVFERVMLAWLACMFADTPMQRPSRGSGR